MIREAMEKWLTSRPQRRLDGMLWVSDLGMHPAKAMRRVLHEEMSEFDANTLVKMQSGNAMEADTEQALRFAYPGVITQFPLFNEVWSGYADFVLGHGTDEVTIIEHKAQGDKWFDYKQSLPRSTHVCQTWLYGQLYEEMYGVRPELVIFYRAWGNWAEFRLTTSEKNKVVVVNGLVDGETAVRTLPIWPKMLQRQLEAYYRDRVLPGLDIDENTWNYAEESYERLLAIESTQESLEKLKAILPEDDTE